LSGGFSIDVRLTVIEVIEMLSCIRYRNWLGAFLDGELKHRESEAIAVHVAKCAACQKRLEDIRGLEEVLHGTLLVPPLSDGLAARVMREAREKRRSEVVPARPFPPIGWKSLRWIAELSAPMRIAACVTMLLAFVVGLSLNGRQLTGVGMSGEAGKSLYGLEWFEPTPPGSIGSVYIAMATRPYQEGNTP